MLPIGSVGMVINTLSVRHLRNWPTPDPFRLYRYSDKQAEIPELLHRSRSGRSARIIRDQPSLVARSGRGGGNWLRQFIEAKQTSRLAPATSESGPGTDISHDRWSIVLQRVRRW